MNHTEFAAIGAALYGFRWKSHLAGLMGVTRVSVSRWAGGQQPVPPYAAQFVKLLIRSRGTVLSLCDRTGVMVRPWAEAGYQCLCVDLQHEETRREGNITFIGADLREWLPPPRTYAIVFAFPPCTDLAVSGARWFRGKGIGGLSDGVDLVESCRRICEWAEAPWMLENPVGVLSSYWRKPDHTFDPCDFGGYLDPPGDAYTKKTCLWTGRGFVMPRRKRVEPTEADYIHNMPPSEDRGDIRSVTPAGFARAVLTANSRHIGHNHGVSR